MDRDIYEYRAEMVGGTIAGLFDELDNHSHSTDEGRSARHAILREIEILSKIERDTADILLEDDSRKLKLRELDDEREGLVRKLQSEKDDREARIEESRSELIFREKELEMRMDSDQKDRDVRIEESKSEMSMRRCELESADRNSSDRVAADISAIKSNERIQDTKSVTEKFTAVVGIAVAAIGLISTVVSVAGTFRALKAAMEFEKLDAGGIVPSKYVSTILKMPR